MSSETPQPRQTKKVVAFGATGTIGKAVVAALSPKYEVVQVGNRQGEFKADFTVIGKPAAEVAKSYVKTIEGQQSGEVVEVQLESLILS